MLDYSRAVCSAKPTGVTGAAQVHKVCTGLCAVVLCINAYLQQSGLQCKTNRCSCTDMQG